MNGSTYCVRAYVAVRDSNGAMFIGRHKLTTNFIYYLGTALNIGARWIRSERREKHELASVKKLESALIRTLASPKIHLFDGARAKT